jgi:hypothetical protein
VKLAATKFATKESTELAATSIGKSVDDIARIGVNIKLLSPENIKKTVDLILNDTNKINHIFQSKHKLDPLINIL